MNVFFAPAALPPAWRRRLIDALELRFAATGALRYRAVTLNLFPYAGLAAKAHHRHPGIGGAIEHIKGCPCGSGSTRDKTGDDRGIRGILRCWGTCSSFYRTALAVFRFPFLVFVFVCSS
jgi:hypothetical protein